MTWPLYLPDSSRSCNGGDESPPFCSLLVPETAWASSVDVLEKKVSDPDFPGGSFGTSKNRFRSNVYRIDRGAKSRLPHVRSVGTKVQIKSGITRSAWRDYSCRMYSSASKLLISVDRENYLLPMDRLGRLPFTPLRLKRQENDA